MSVLKVRKYGKLKKDVVKRPCLTLLYKSLLCDLMIFLTPYTHDLISAYRIRIRHYTHDLISC